MKVEITRASVDDAVHPGAHEEFWVRVLSNQPMSPEAWREIRDRGVILDAGDDKAVSLMPCAFYTEVDEPDEDGTFDGYGFEQWFIFPIYTKGERA